MAHVFTDICIDPSGALCSPSVQNLRRYMRKKFSAEKKCEVMIDPNQ